MTHDMACKGAGSDRQQAGLCYLVLAASPLCMTQLVCARSMPSQVTPSAAILPLSAS